MARIVVELKAKAVGVIFLGAPIATKRFFDTLDKIERALDDNA